MKKFEVELKRTSYIVYTVEANTKEEAEDKAWELLRTDADYDDSLASWDVEFIEETKAE